MIDWTPVIVVCSLIVAYVLVNLICKLFRKKDRCLIVKDERKFNIFKILFIFLLIAPPLIASEQYSRELFKHWSDPDFDGEDSREEELISGMATGIVCPYTGVVVSKTGDLDVDHVIPLKWAWFHGADTWSNEKREKFANDPDNLLPVLATVNRSKGAKGPDEWLPPNTYFIPEYCAMWVAKCREYELECDYNLLSLTIEKYKKFKKGINPKGEVIYGL